MYRKIPIIAVVLTCAWLVGCTTYGVDNSTWKSLSPAERQLAMKHYYRAQEQQQAQQAEIDRINAKNAPINNALNTMESAIETAGGDRGHQKCVTDNFNRTVCGYNCYVDEFGSG